MELLCNLPLYPPPNILELCDVSSPSWSGHRQFSARLPVETKL